MAIQEKLLQILKEDQIKREEPMQRHTTFRVGGPAEWYLCPNMEQLADVIAVCRREKQPVQIIGNGSNLLVGDRGIRGVVIEIGSQMGEILREGDILTVQAGATLARVAQEALKYSLTGFEFAAGIPGTMGGAVFMNAGAYGGEIRDVLEYATVLLADGTLEKFTADQLQLSYRHSILQTMEGVVVEAVIRLKKGEPEAIRSRMEELRQQRTQKQPLEFPSAGSTFKRPEGYFAGKLIMDAGLAGFQVGGAQVSEKHCGFVINRDQATAADIQNLMQQVSDCVFERFQVRLEPEVKQIGDF